VRAATQGRPYIYRVGLLCGGPRRHRIASCGRPRRAAPTCIAWRPRATSDRV